MNCFVICASPANGLDNSRTIIVDFGTRLITPQDPTMNINGNQSVVIAIRPSTGSYVVKPSVGVPRGGVALLSLATQANLLPAAQQYLGKLANQPSGTAGARDVFDAEVTKSSTPAKDPQTRAALLENLRVAADTVAAAATDDKGSEIGDQFVLNFSQDAKDLDYAVQDGVGSSWTVHLVDRGPRDYAVTVACAKTNDNCKGSPITLVLHLQTAWASLSWSGGFTLSSLRDERYRLDPDASDSKLLDIVRLGRSGAVPIQLGFFAHYCLVRDNVEMLCPVSVGLASNLKEGIQISLGTGARVKPIPTTDSFYLTAGVVYGQRQVLADDFVGRPHATVPVGTSVDTILKPRYGFGGFVGLSFGFFGSGEKFKGVYPGSNKPPTPEPTAPAAKETPKPPPAGPVTTPTPPAGDGSNRDGL